MKGLRRVLTVLIPLFVCVLFVLYFQKREISYMDLSAEELFFQYEDQLQEALENLLPLNKTVQIHVDEYGVRVSGAEPKEIPHYRKIVRLMKKLGAHHLMANYTGLQENSVFVDPPIALTIDIRDNSLKQFVAMQGEDPRTLFGVGNVYPLKGEWYYVEYLPPCGNAFPDTN